MDASTSSEDHFLTTEEDSFALAVVEFNGNLKAAYQSIFGSEVEYPISKARILLAKPAVAGRVQELLTSSNEAAQISLSAHLAELAEIRDLAKMMNQPKTAMQAERSRGEAAGFYKTKIELPEGLDLELAKNAQALKSFVDNTVQALAGKLPV